MINWWPVTTSRLEDPDYQHLTPAERLYLEYIIGEYSLRGPFTESDLEIAVTLDLSEDKVRRARRRVGRATDYDRLLRPSHEKQIETSSRLSSLALFD